MVMLLESYQELGYASSAYIIFDVHVGFVFIIIGGELALGLVGHKKSYHLRILKFSSKISN